MKYFLRTVIYFISILGAVPLSAGYENYMSDDFSEDEVIEITAVPVKSEYTQAQELLTEKFGEEMASRILPARFDQVYFPTWLDRTQVTQMQLWLLLEDKPAEMVTYGLNTLMLNASIKFVYEHFIEISEFFEGKTNGLKDLLPTTQKIKFHSAKHLQAVIGEISGIENLDPKPTTVLWDLHGTLTKVATPRSGQTNADPRNLAFESVNALKERGVNNVIVSAWNNTEEVVAQLRHIGLAEVFEIPDVYAVQSGKIDSNGTTVYYLKAGNVVSVKINPSDIFYKDKIYALDVLGINSGTVIFVEDSSGNVSKAAISFPLTKASETLDALHLIKLGPTQEDEPAQFSENSLNTEIKNLNLN